MNDRASGPAATTIVVPCYNEASRLPVERFIEFIDQVNDVHFMFCNDGSTDETEAVLDGLVERTGGRASRLSLTHNQGKAEAVRQGLLAALARGTAYCGYFDADLATPLRELPAMLERFSEPDVVAVTGARVRLQGTRIERRAPRHYAGRVFATAAAIALGTPYYDTQCGAKLFRRCPSLERSLAEPFHSSWIFDVELIGRLMISTRRAGGPSLFREHPLTAWNDVGGSKVNASAFVRAPLELLRVVDQLQRWKARLDE